MILHVIPANDSKPHEDKSTCACDPRIEIINGNMIFIHDAYDGRVGIEIANEILNGDVEEKLNINRLIKQKKSIAREVPISDYEGRVKKIDGSISITEDELKDRNDSLKDSLLNDIDNQNTQEDAKP